MAISTNYFYQRVNSQLDRLGTQAQATQDQISTGKRISKPSDDALAYRQLAQFSVASADDKAFGANITLAQSILNQADSTLGNVTTQLQRAQELVVQGSNGTLSDADRKVIAEQLRGVIDDLVGLANTQDGRGVPLFAAATGDTAITRDAAGVVSFTGTGNPPSIPVGTGDSVQPSESAEKVFGGITTANGTTDIFAVLSSFATALETPGAAATNGASGAALDGITGALDNVSAARSSVGARGARLELEQSRLTDAATARETSRSALEDTNITDAVVQLQRTSTILQTTQQSLARLSQLSLFNFLN